MRPEVLPRLVCPRCRGSLRFHPSWPAGDAVDAGSLRCETCGESYPIEQGVPRLLVETPAVRDVQRSFGAQWRLRTEGRFETDTLFGLRREEELSMFFEALNLRPEDLAGQWVLDAGCGSARLTRELARFDAEVVGLDATFAVEYAARRYGDVPNLHFVQGSILDIPLADASFDIVWSMGVIHHTGDTVRAFRNLARVVRPGGRLYVWVYSSRRLSLYKLIRDALRFSYKIPEGLLFYVCYLMAPPLKLYHLAKFAVRRLRGRPITPRERREAEVRTIAFELHDDLSPRYQTRHTPEEVTGWFRERGFSDVVVVDEVGVRGVHRAPGAIRQRTP